MDLISPRSPAPLMIGFRLPPLPTKFSVSNKPSLEKSCNSLETNHWRGTLFMLRCDRNTVMATCLQQLAIASIRPPNVPVTFDSTLSKIKCDSELLSSQLVGGSSCLKDPDSAACDWLSYAS